jgi:hypothetical protein
LANLRPLRDSATNYGLQLPLMQLKGFYFADPRMFVIPIEHLSVRGMSEAYADAVRAERGVSEGWIALFNEAFALYTERIARLYARAPETWFPPRLQNVCIVTDALHTRPYYQPFHQASWLLYQCDFDPHESNTELASYQFAHIERFCLSRSIAAAVVHNLSWLLVLEDAQTDAFAEACRKTSRPDGDAFRALAGALPWIRRLYHEKLKRPVLALPEPFGRLEAAELMVPLSVQGDLRALVDVFTKTASEAVVRYHAAHQGGEGADTICDYLRDEAPLVVITGVDGTIVWDPEAASELTAVRGVLEGVGSAVAESVRADLAIVGERSRRFLESLRDRDALPYPSEEIDQSGLSYIHRDKKLVAYNLRERELDRLREPAAPYERLMLGARTIHEWCHLAVDAGWVHVPPELAADHAVARAELATLFEDIVARAPGPLRALAAQEVRALAQPGQSAGEAMVSFFLRRMDDYLANVLARRFCSLEELETYVRQQVTTLAQENIGPFAQLARYAYEFQYLSLSAVDDPLRYFLEGSWFREHFGEILSEEKLAALFSAAGRVCACYRIDEEAFSLPRS